MVAGKYIIGSALLALTLLAAGVPASAQELSLNALIERLDRLERDLGGVQRLLAREGVPEDAYQPVEPRGAADGGNAARQEIRIGELQEQIRMLTGQVEEAGYAARQLSEQMSKANTDYEERLTALEQRLAGGAPPMASGQPPTQFSTPTHRDVPYPGTQPTTRVANDPNAERYESMDSLGTISNESTGAAVTGETPDATAAAPTPNTAQTAVAAAAATPETEYDQAYQLLQQADYVGAEGALQRFIETNPEHPLAGNAYYWLGETYYVRNDYQAAAVAFARGYKGFPEGSKAADNLLKLGMAFAAMDKTEEACATFARLDRDQAKATALVRERLATERDRAGCA